MNDQMLAAWERLNRAASRLQYTQAPSLSAALQELEAARLALETLVMRQALRQPATGYARFPKHLEGLASKAFQMIENGEDPSDMLAMLEHGLRKSPVKPEHGD